MKCPKCGTEVKEGNLFCPKCLEEMQWVPEYNTVETIFHRHEASREKRIQSLKSQIKEKGHRQTSRRRKLQVSLFWMVILCCAILVAAGYQMYRNANSYSHQYASAQMAFNTGDYEKALEKIDRAIDLDTSHPSAYCLLAEALCATDDYAGAVKVMESQLDQMPNSSLIYGELISLYMQDQKQEKIKDLMDHCQNQKIKTKFQDYLASDPIISYDTGSYGKEFQVTITGDDVSFYYTLDGSKPDDRSDKYEKPLTIQEGTTELKVVGYNALGIPSDVLYRKYIVALKVPDAPVILPEEQEFHENTQITIQVPEGCVCYYAFDAAPNTSSTTYTGPIVMPEGTHILYAFLLSGNGKQSELSAKTYTLNY